MDVTIKEIAKISGVGISTVSRVINNAGSVSNATKQRVMAVVKELNYIPNNSARSLKLGQSKNVALMVKGMGNPFFQKMIKVIEQKAALRGYPLFIQNVNESENELEFACKEMQDRNLCGVIIMGGSFNYTNDEFRRLGIPCVLVTVSAGENVEQNLYSSVMIDDEAEAFKATEYLISLGHKRIGFINNIPVGITTPNSLRYNGYVRALKEYDIPYDTSLIAADFSLSSGYQFGFDMMKQLIARNRDMTAVFAFADIIAVGAAKAVFSAGLKVPEDISIIGFDGVEAAEYYNPSLDTICQPADQMALSAIEILFSMIQGSESEHIVFDSVLLKRGSCRSIK